MKEKKEDDDSEEQQVTKSNLPCKADESIESDVDSLLVILQQVDIAWDKRDLSAKKFQIWPPKNYFRIIISYCCMNI